MRCLLTATIVLAACTPHDEPDLLVTFGTDQGQNASVAIEGDRVHVFYDALHVVDLATGEVANLGATIGGVSRYAEVVVADGWAHWLAFRWDEPDEFRIGRLGDSGDDEEVSIGVQARGLVARGGCAWFSTTQALHQWCPADPAPVEIPGDGPFADVAVDEGAIYYSGADDLYRIDRATGERTALGVGGQAGAELAIDGDRLVWWRGGDVHAVATTGGAAEWLGTLPDLGTSSYADLDVDELGYFRAGWRLRRGGTTAEEWLPGRSPVVADGHAAWIEFDPRAQQSHLYTLPSDAAAPPPPGGEADTLRPPFL
jgi:hypothetical protein